MNIKQFLLSLILYTICTSASPGQVIDIDTPELGENNIHADLDRENRTLNLKGQCVWNSITNASRQIGEEKLYNLIKDRRCQGGASPSDVAKVLPTFGVKWKQETNRTKCYELIREAMSLGIPCSVSYGRAHVLNLVEYNEESNIAIIVNNHTNNRFQNKKMTIKEFDKNFRSWVVVVFAPPEKENELKEFRLKHRKINLDYFAPNGDLYYDDRFDLPEFHKR